MGDTGRLLRSTFEARRIQLPARVTSIPLDADGKSSGYVLAEISGQTGVKVRIGPSDNYYPGDWIAAEQVGGGAGAQYVAAGFVAGSRPQSGVWEITTPTTIGTETFDAGDVVHGNPYDTHWWYDYSVGRWNVRQANATRGALGPLADTYDYALGSAALGFVFGDYTDTWIAGDDVNGFRIFSGAVQRVALNTDGSGWFVDADVFSWDTAGNLTLAGDFQANSLRIGERAAGPAIRGGEVIELDSLGDPLPEDTERYGLRIYDETGLPKIALLTGTRDHPTAPALYVGAADADNYLRYDGDGLRLAASGAVADGALITLSNSSLETAAYGLLVTAAGGYGVKINGPDGGLLIEGTVLPALKAIGTGPYPTLDISTLQDYAIRANAWTADEGRGALLAIGGTYAITMQDAPMNAGGQAIENVLILYLGPKNTEGTWCIVSDGANLLFQRQEAGILVTKHTITP